jgi:predicted O-methyltransferase YrrM
LRFREAAVDGLSFGIRWFSYKGPLGFDEVEDAPLTYLYTRRDELGRKRQKLFVRGATVRFMRLHWLEEGARELPIDDTDIFFHHYEQRSYRFEDGKKAQATRDPYMLRFADRLSLADPPPRPSSEEEWIEHINAAIESAEQCRSRLSAEALAVDGMCGRYTRHFYNNLCRFKSCRYLEIGSYHGASTCAAIYANDVSATCIDNWSEFRGKRHHFEAAIGAHRGKADVEVIESDCFDLDASKLGPFDVYLYDGNHSQRSQYLAIERFVPALAEYGVVVIDDWNRAPVRQGTEEAIRALRLDVPFRREIAPPAEDCADANREKGSQTWWNGLCIMLVRRPSP